MSELVSTPDYVLDDEVETVDIGEFDVEVTYKGETWTEKATLQWVNHATPWRKLIFKNDKIAKIFYLDCETVDFLKFHKEVDLKINKESLEYIIRNSGASRPLKTNGETEDEMVFSLELEVTNDKILLWGNTEEKINKVGLDVLSFCRLNTPLKSVKIDDKYKSYNSINIKFGEWVIMVQSVLNLGNMKSKSIQKGKYLSSQIMIFQKSDESEFLYKEFEEIFDKVELMLSFLNGSEIQYHAAFGFLEKKRFEISRQPRSFAGLGVGIFDYIVDENEVEGYVQELADGFFSFCDSENIVKMLKKVIEWYMEANKSTYSSTSIVRVQSAMEVLFDHFCTASKKMNASDKIRKLLSYCKIEINEDMKEMSKKVANKTPQNLEDIPRFMTEIRNSIVHPKEKDFNMKIAIPLAKEYSLWCFELVMLSICKYNGKYRNRLLQLEGEIAQCQVEPVPWAKPKTAR